MITIASPGLLGRRSLKALALWSGVVVVAGAAGIYAAQQNVRALVLSGLVLAASIAVLEGGRGERWRSQRWIPYAWVALFLSASFRFTLNNPIEPSVSSVSPENIVQLLVYATVALLVVHSRRLSIAEHPVSISMGPLLAWPLLAVASTVWSLVPLFTLTRALQLFVPIGLALLMTRGWLASPEDAARIWRSTFRLFVQVVTILTLIGFAIGPLFYPDQTRFTWPGAHPITASTYLAIAVLVLLGFGRSFLQLRVTGYYLRLLLFAVAMYMGQTRGTLGAMAVAIAVLLWFRGRQKPLTRYLGMFYYGTAVLLVLAVALPTLEAYLRRDGDLDALATLNGRIGLWQESIQLVSEGSAWIAGFGYGAARVLLPDRVAWAGTAHSSWVELLMGLGIVGVLLAAADVVFLLRRLSSRGSFTSPAATLSLLAFLAVSSLVTEALVTPGVAFGMLALLHAPALAQLTTFRGASNGFPVAPRPTQRDVRSRHAIHPSLRR